MSTNIAELRKQSKLPAKQAGGGNVQAFFEHNKPTLQAVLPKHLNADRMLKIALGALRTTPKLMECTVESLFGAIVTCSQLGLEPNTPMGHAYLIPFGNRKMNRTDVQLIIGYKGLVDLARRSGQIESISARIVHENDEFDVEYGTVDEIRHRPLIFGDRGEIIGVYAVAKLKDGGRQFEFMSVAEVNKIRDGSQGYQTAKRFNRTDHPWQAFWTEMAKKSAIRRLCKYLPMSIELASAVALDGAAEAGKTPRYEDALQGEFTIDDPESPASPEQEPPADAARIEAGADEWPQLRQVDGSNRWYDSAGTGYDKSLHAWSEANMRPAVNKDGTFRAKRGAKQEETGIPECPAQHVDLLADLASIRDEHGLAQAQQALADAEGLSDDDRALLGDLLRDGGRS